jgi:rSAM/selenodomain-associated transferase 2
MIPKTSVIIPVLNEEGTILEALRAARQDYSPNELEIIVVDGGSRDKTLSLLPADVRLLHSAPNRGRQMNLGAAIASGEIFAFCHADCQLPAGWREAVIAKLSEPDVSGGTFQLSILPERGVLKLRNRIHYPPDWRFMYGDQVQFMTRRTFERAGGFQEIPILEDLEMSRALHRLGKLRRIPLRVKTSSRQFSGSKPGQQWLLNIRCVILYLYCGKTAEEVRQIYERGGRAGA